MNLKENKITSSVAFDGRIFRVEVDGVELPDGRRSVRECVRHSGGAAVLFVKNGDIALVKQFRYVYGEETYEIPAGKLNAGEDPQAAAARELEEETGYRAGDMRKLLEIYPSPGYTDEIIHIYLVDEGVFVGQKLDEGEFLNVCFMPVKEVLRLVLAGEIRDSKTVCAVLAYACEHNKN